MWIGGRRIPPAAMFPAGQPAFRIHRPQINNGLTLRVVDTGPLDAPHTVVCIHGWGCSAYSYRHVLPHLAAAGLRAVAIDLPGHGLSDKPRDRRYYNKRSFVQTIDSVCGRLGITTAIVVGHSMGGPVAAGLAVHSPTLVQGLVLLAPVGFGYPGHLALASRITPEWLAPLLPYVTPRWLAWLALRLSYGDGMPPTSTDLDQYWAPSRDPNFVRALQTLLHHFEWQAGTTGAFDGIAAPTTILFGEKDPLVPPADAAKYLAPIPSSTLLGLPGCGHAIADECPEAVNSAILRMVKC